MAYKNQVTALASDSSVPSFLALMQQVELCLLGGGWVQTADTGQAKSGLVPGITGTTVTNLPASSNFTIYFQLWKMNDALQATAPVFLKIYFGQTGSGLAMYAEIGTGSTGAGVLTNIKYTSSSINSTAIGASTSRCHFGSDTNRVVFGLWTNSGASKQSIFSLERSHNSDGTDNGDGLLLLRTGQSNSYANRFVSLGGIVQSADNSSLLADVGTGMTTGVEGLNVYLFPIRVPFLKPQYPVKSVAVYFRNDITENTIIPVSFYGATKNYITLGGDVTTIGYGSGVSYAILWD